MLFCIIHISYCTWGRYFAWYRKWKIHKGALGCARTIFVRMTNFYFYIHAAETKEASFEMLSKFYIITSWYIIAWGCTTAWQSHCLLFRRPLNNKRKISSWGPKIFTLWYATKADILHKFFQNLHGKKASIISWLNRQFGSLFSDVVYGSNLEVLPKRTCAI